MAPAPDCECSSDPSRPLKGLPIRLWFDNPAYCIPPTVSVASSPMDSPFPADDVPTRRSSSEADNERFDVLPPSAACRRRSLPDTLGRLPDTFGGGKGHSLLSYCLEMASERSPDPDRPLKGLPIKFWFDNPAYCISPTVSAASSPMGRAAAAADVLR
ncbi:hypothetical protein T484DRAFT_1814914 [Baffinella frigidus]|nr:hypothetical protein T484DRAFT_1814914 [Cryptophyta sp. CCMP2293]